MLIWSCARRYRMMPRQLHVDLYRMFSMLYDDYIYGINTQCLTFTGPSARQLIISSDKLITSIRKVTFLFWTVFIFLFPQHTFRKNLELHCISSNNHLTIPFSPTIYTFPWLGSIFHNRKVEQLPFPLLFPLPRIKPDACLLCDSPHRWSNVLPPLQTSSLSLFFPS